MSDHETPCRIRIYLIRVVLVQQRHVSVPTRTSIRAIGEIRVLKKIFVSFGLFVFIIISCSNSSERPAANKIREIREIRVRIKRQRKIRVKKYSCHSSYYFPSVSGPTANLVFKRPSNRNIIPVKATIKNSKQ